MELVLPMYNAHPYFCLKNLGKKVCTSYGKIWHISLSACPVLVEAGQGKEDS